MKKVDFFIVGSPKCGTTALAQNLEQNTSIVISSPKEPHYFSSDLNTGGYMPTSDEEYLSHFFPKDKKDGVLWGDASVWHMYSETAIKNISKHNQDAKIVVMIRNPAKAAFSLHQQMIFQGQEDILNFRDAWKESDSRFSRTSYPAKMTVDPRLIAYKHAYSFYEQLVNIHKFFSPDQILIVSQEEFQKNGVETINKVTKFIGAPVRKFNLQRTNETFYMKSSHFTNILRARIVIRLAVLIKKYMKIKSFGVGRPSQPFLKEYETLVLSELAENLEKIRKEFNVDLINAK